MGGLLASVSTAAPVVAAPGRVAEWFRQQTANLRTGVRFPPRPLSEVFPQAGPARSRDPERRLTIVLRANRVQIRHARRVSNQAADRVWVAFLRGMNLGGRRLANEELQAAVEACGCRDVRTYQASGNVVVVDGRSEEELVAALEEGLGAALSYAVPVFLRSATEVRRIAAATPFSEAEKAASSGQPQVILLRAELSADALRQVQALIAGDDHMVPAGRQLHWLPAAGLADNGVALRRLDAVTGGTTIRTQGTVQRLASKLL